MLRKKQGSCDLLPQMFLPLFQYFLVVQTTISTVVGMKKSYDDFCIVGELSGRRFVIRNGKKGCKRQNSKYRNLLNS